MSGTGILLLFLILIQSLFAQTSSNNHVVSGDTVSIGNIKPSLTISRCENNAITVDGVLDEPAWKKCEAAKDFVEIDPGDNTKPPVETEAYFTYDDNNFYAAFICYDNDMSKLLAGMSDRDNMFSDDWVGMIIDTYGDHKQAYEMFSNPKGIQGDGIWTPTGENMDFDMLYQTEAKIYKDKWIVEFAVPFKSLRFPDKNIQSWDIHIIRTRPRQNRTQMSWAVVSKDNPEFLSQAGTIKGLKDLKKGHKLEILPYVIGTKFDTLSSGNNPSSGLTNNIPSGNFGVGLKYGLTSNLTAELVYNPDFSQVESDAAQISVNSASALYYPEKRPFFLEGSNIFSTTLSTVYTKLFNDPLFAGKIVGHAGKFDIGFLSIYDRHTPFIIPFKYGSNFIIADTVKSFSNVLRIKRDLNGESYFGLILTDREVESGHNRVFGLDGKLKFGNNDAFSWQLMEYMTKEINSPQLYSDTTVFNHNGNTLGFNGESYSGFGGVIAYDHSARLWSYGTALYQLPPEARQDVGYIVNNDYRNLTGYAQLNIFPQKGFTVKFFPAVNGNIRYDFDGRIKEQTLVPNFFIQFKDRLDASGYFLAVNNEQYLGVYLQNVRRGSLSVDVLTNNVISGGLTFEIGKYIVRFEDPPFIGFGYSANAYLTLKPLNGLRIDNTYSYSQLSESYGGQKLYAGYIFRNKLSFQFTKNLFLRLVTQYNSFSGELDIDPLFSYKWNPFTIFYIGSTHNITDYGSDSLYGGRFIQTQRQIFAKFQYLFTL